MMLADIAHGHVDGADWLFLIAAIVFVVAAFVHHVRDGETRTWVAPLTLTNVGLALVAFAWLLL